MKKLALIISLMAVIGLVMGACGDDDNGGSAKQCLEACEVAADCVYTGTEEADWKCEGKRCVPNLCSSNDDCTAMMSGWTTECTDGGGECATGFVCIKVGSGGLCALEPACTAPMEEIQMPAIDDSGDVDVCARTGYTCSGGMCQAPGCTSDTDCTVAAYPFCVSGACVECKTDSDCTGAMTKCTSIGMCGCASDEECTGGMTKCTSVGFCGCVDDTECTTATADVCYDGACGCSSVDVCTGTTTGDNTTWVCEKN